LSRGFDRATLDADFGPLYLIEYGGWNSQPKLRIEDDLDRAVAHPKFDYPDSYVRPVCEHGRIGSIAGRPLKADNVGFACVFFSFEEGSGGGGDVGRRNSVQLA